MVTTLAGRQRPLGAFEDEERNTEAFQKAERQVINTLCQVSKRACILAAGGRTQARFQVHWQLYHACRGELLI